MTPVVNRYQRLSPIQRSLVSAIIGFMIYGAWAVFVNFMHGEERAFRAGFVQGAYSFVLTFFMTLILEASYRRSYTLLTAKGPAIVLTVLISCGLVFSGSWLINYLSGTPEIFKTVILGYVLGGVYSIAYTVALAKEHSSAQL